MIAEEAAGTIIPGEVDFIREEAADKVAADTATVTITTAKTVDRVIILVTAVAVVVAVAVAEAVTGVRVEIVEIGIAAEAEVAAVMDLVVKGVVATTIEETTTIMKAGSLWTLVGQLQPTHSLVLQLNNTFLICTSPPFVKIT